MSFRSLVNSLVGILNVYIIPTIFALILLIFLWGVAQYFIFSGGDETARAKGKQFALWGIVGIVVLVTLWGIVNALLSTLNLPG